MRPLRPFPRASAKLHCRFRQVRAAPYRLWAQRAGLVCEVYPPALTDEYTLGLAATVARHSPLALRAAKQSLRLSQEVSLQAGLQQERQLFTLLSATEDRREGIDAFLHKRTAEFKGR